MGRTTYLRNLTFLLLSEQNKSEGFDCVLRLCPEDEDLGYLALAGASSLACA